MRCDARQGAGRKASLFGQGRRVKNIIDTPPPGFSASQLVSPPIIAHACLKSPPASDGAEWDGQPCERVVLEAQVRRIN